MVVYWCLATLSMDHFNPHQVGAVSTFIEQHPESCKAEPSDFLMIDNVTVETCRRRAMLSYMPGWMQKPANKDRVFLGSDCVPYPVIPGASPLNLDRLKTMVSP